LKSAYPFKRKLIRVSPVGMNVGPAIGRPVLIFKDSTGNYVLPVWLDYMDAGLMMADSNTRVRSSGVHYGVLKIFDAAGIVAERVVFDDIVGHNQFLSVQFRQGKSKPKTVRLRAAEVMSFCLKSGAAFYATKEVIEKSRQIDLTMQAVQGGFGHGFGDQEIPDSLKN
jgi:hypothetical protein